MSVSTKSTTAHASTTTSAVDELIGDFPPSARVWLYGITAPLSAESEARLNVELQRFCESWKAHGKPLAARGRILAHRFIAVIADEEVEAPSGCSIDAMVRTIRETLRSLGGELAPDDLVFVREQGEIVALPRGEFAMRVGEGKFKPDDRVFDLTAARAGDLQVGIEKRFADSWHSRAF